jgi:hypothetical protein
MKGGFTVCNPVGLSQGCAGITGNDLNGAYGASSWHWGRASVKFLFSSDLQGLFP